GRIAINDLLVYSGDDGAADDLSPLLRRDGPDLAVRREDHRAVHHSGNSLLVKERHECFADTKLGNHLFDINLRICAKSLCSGFDGFLIAWREGTARVLYPVAELTQYGFWYVEGVLSNE